MIKRELPVASADHSRGVGEEDRGAAPGNGLVEIAREVPEDRGAFPISGSGEKWQQAPAVKCCGRRASGGFPKSGLYHGVRIASSSSAQSSAGFGQRGVLLQVDSTVFHAAPESLDEYVVHPPVLAIHADGDPQFRQPSGPFLRGELAALIGSDRRETFSGSRLSSRFRAPRSSPIIA